MSGPVCVGPLTRAASIRPHASQLYFRCLELCRRRCPIRCHRCFVQFEQGFQLPLLCLMNRPMRVDVVSEPRLRLPDITTYPEPVRPCRCRYLPQDRCHRWWAVYQMKSISNYYVFHSVEDKEIDNR
uniref:Uncharacterized protein n=1 Tax=Anopheles atroparvus TaxID=41427 RepID=A0A182JBD7_ANOAO